jgi:hypothetical protein
MDDWSMNARMKSAKTGLSRAVMKTVQDLWPCYESEQIFKKKCLFITKTAAVLRNMKQLLDNYCTDTIFFC